MRPLLLLIALVAVLFSGCAGQGNSAGADPSTESTTPTASPTNTTKPPEDEFVPKFHYHDYWLDRPKVMLFDPSHTLKIGEDNYNEFFQSNDAMTIGTVTFDPDTDGEDGEGSQETDVVYQGTNRIEVKVTWTDTNNIPGLVFWYSPANTPDMLRLGEVKSGQTYFIDLKENWADMPHQLSVSRWAFRLDAYDSRFDGYPAKVHRAKGEIHVEMWIHNGGEKFIDPPHPYFFKAGPTRSAGHIYKNLTDCLVVNSTRVNQYAVPPQPLGFQCGHSAGPIDLRPDAPYIVPWETTTLVIDLYYNISSKASPIAHKVGVVFHGADALRYRFPTAKVDEAGHLRYEVAVTEKMSDTPYADETDWRYGLYPILNGNRDLGGDLTGNFHIALTAVKAGDTSDRGMGN